MMVLVMLIMLMMLQLPHKKGPGWKGERGDTPKSSKEVSDEILCLHPQNPMRLTDGWHLNKCATIHTQVRGTRYSSTSWKRRGWWKSSGFRRSEPRRGVSPCSQFAGRAWCRGGLVPFVKLSFQNLKLRGFSQVRIRVQGPTPQSSMQSMSNKLKLTWKRPNWQQRSASKPKFQGIFFCVVIIWSKPICHLLQFQSIQDIVHVQNERNPVI